MRSMCRQPEPQSLIPRSNLWLGNKLSLWCLFIADEQHLTYPPQAFFVASTSFLLVFVIRYSLA
ncbi:hypothetical protein BDV32DRAFT_123240 [Aspergillus pseudonomiae]|nr:hypothetical protein BDV32DRAFT_123240 [Aspergillus pseudonomiae]